MIGFVYGKVVFSDGEETIILTQSGIGYRVNFFEILLIEKFVGLYISHIHRENAEELFGFHSISDLKAFEWLLKVKGVGPKSAYSLIKSIGTQALFEAITFENKKILQQAPGVGPKAASQIILDLKDKISKIKIYEDKIFNRSFLKNKESSLEEKMEKGKFEKDLIYPNIEENEEKKNNLKLYHQCINEAVLACKELGYSEQKILPMAQKIMVENNIYRAELLVQLILKEM